MMMTLMFLEVSTLILGLIALDRYIAILHPLRYHAILTDKIVLILVAVCWVTGALVYIGNYMIAMMVVYI